MRKGSRGPRVEALQQTLAALGYYGGELNSRLDALAATLTTVTSPVVVVDQATGFNANSDTFDGIHPNEVGEQKMATKWFDALEANWPTVGGECDL